MAGLGIGAALIAHPGVAQDSADPSGDIVVTGRGLADPEPRSTGIAVIDLDRLTATASNRLEDALADIAGLQSFRRADSRSANPTSQGITLRGIGGSASSRALLILDGVPQADPFAGWVAFPAYSVARLGQVRVARGGGGVRWGSGALAGVIDLRSATPDQLPPLSASIAYGSRNSVDAQASATFERGSGFATLDAGYARGDGFVPIVAEDRGPADRAAPYEQFNASARAVVRVAPHTELQATVQGFSDRRERGLASTAIASDGADASLRVVGNGAWRYSALAYVQARQFASQFASIDDARTVASQVLDQYSVPAIGLGGRLEVAPPIGEAIELRFGSDVRSTGGTTHEFYSYVDGAPTRRREAGGTTRTLGGFADLTWSPGAIRLDASARIDRWWIEDGRLFEQMLGGGAPITDTGFADRSGTEPTGRIGAAWSLAAAVTLRGAAYRAWRLPTPNELYRPFRVGADAVAANAELRPETLDGVEAGVDLALGERMTLGATLFANRLNDAIANVTIARGPGNFPGVGFVSAAGFYRQRRNLGAIDARGIEVDGEARLGAVRMALSYAYADPVVRAAEAAPALDGLRPAQVPQHQASATLAWQRGAWRAGTTLRYASRQYEDDQNSRSLAQALTLDAIAALPLTKAVAIEARAENLFDARVETGFSGDAIERARPRQLWIGLRASLE
ncbi:TonB-dependent receptor [Sphingomonas japonica]|uniref:TonB-dependent receptor n=1 Tax=Sphingomonas japonica TaxID=511662 RepID=UPI00111E9216|nr:TonB-dependent receptor [Sphingomonas japonica]